MYTTHTHTHTHTHTRTHARTHARTERESRASGEWSWREGSWKEDGFHGRFKGSDRGRMMDRNCELVQDNWSPVSERALTTELCSEGCYSEHSGVCWRAQLVGRSVIECEEVPQGRWGIAMWGTIKGYWQDDLHLSERWNQTGIIVHPTRRAELPGRSVNVKKLWKVDGTLPCEGWLKDTALTCLTFIWTMEPDRIHRASHQSTQRWSDRKFALPYLSDAKLRAPRGILCTISLRWRRSISTRTFQR